MPDQFQFEHLKNLKFIIKFHTILKLNPAALKSIILIPTNLK